MRGCWRSPREPRRRSTSDSPIWITQRRISMPTTDYYDILGVARGASGEEIKAAYRALARQHHPDVAEDKAQAEHRFKEINEAYEVLSDPQKRAQYDRFGAVGNGSNGTTDFGFGGGF